MSLGLLLSTVLGVALAETPVVHAHSDQTGVLRRVSERTGLPMEQLRAVHVDTLTSRPATVSGDGSIRHCAGRTVSAPDLRALQLRAEAAWRDEQVQDALDQLDLGITQLGCLRERVDKKTATRMFLLRAGLLAHTGNATDALEEAHSALALTPDIRWDDTLPPEGKAVLDQARATAEDAQLSVVPNVSTPPWVDGKALPPGTPLARRPGLHLVQLPATSGIESAWLTLRGDAVLVLPGGFRAPVLDRMKDDDPALMHLLHATIGTEPTYISTHDGMWLVTWEGDTPSVEVLVAPPTPVVESTDDDSKKKRGRKR